MNNSNTYDTNTDTNTDTTLVWLAQSLRRTRGIMGATDIPLDPTPAQAVLKAAGADRDGWAGSIVRLDFNDGGIMIAGKSHDAEHVTWESFASAKDLDAGDSYYNGVDANLDNFADTVMQAASEAFYV